MFRTSRGFLTVAPFAFLGALIAFFAAHPQAAESYVVYPFLADAIGPRVAKSPWQRFALTSGMFFLLPYLVTGLLVFLADVGVSAATPLWKGPGERPKPPKLAPESTIAFLGLSVVFAITVGALLHRIAHGGELPGDVNIAPVLVAATPFAVLPPALFFAFLVGIPRAAYERFGKRAAEAA